MAAVQIKITPKIEARASSSFTREQVEARIAALRARTHVTLEESNAIEDEITFLRGVLEQMK